MIKSNHLRSSIFFFLLAACSSGGDLNNPDRNIATEKTETPIVASSSPASPAITNSVAVIGTSEANASLQIFTDSNCSLLVGSGNADNAGNFNINTSRIDGGATQTYFAQAQAPGKSLSDCSATSISFRSMAIRPGLAFLSATQTTAGATPTKINQATDFALQWSSAEFDDNFYAHSTSSNSHEVTVSAAGDYFLSLTLPQTMTAGTFRPCVRAEVRVNGTLVPGAIGESSYIRFDPAAGNNESSAHISVVLEGLNPNDVIEVFVQETAGSDGTENVIISDQASLYLEYLSPSRDIFTANATQVVSGANINTGAASALEWTQSKVGASFTHNNGVNPHQITLAAGSYMLYLNLPITSTTDRTSPRVLVQLNGATVNGGQASQGYIRNDSGHNHSSIHWSGLITAAGGEILTLTSAQEANGGTVNIQTGGALLTIERLANSTGVLSLRANNLTSGTDWNPAAPSGLLWENTSLKDATLYSHSTAINQEQITVNEPGDYLLVYNDAINTTGARPSPIIKVKINGVNLAGASTKTHYMRNDSSHTESSASLVFLLRNLSTNDIVSVTTERDVSAVTTNDIQDAIITLIKK